MNIFVGNLLFAATEGDVKKLFEGFGNVASVAIVMRKEKKTPKSRGFGFVQMPDEQQALAAIGALNGKEFMGRVLNVNPARPKGQKAMVWPPIAKAKTEAHRESKLKKMQPKFEAKAEQYSREETEQKKAWFNPVFNKPGTYKGGRRTRSYMKRYGLTEMQEEAKPRRRSQDNPMRWRKKKDKPRPWQKSPGEHKPWEKVEEGARPWEKAGGESKPWRKSEGGIKPWKKPAGEAKPWKKTAGEAKPWKKPAGEAKPWKKTAGEAKPWKKPAGEAKPWSKSNERPQKSRFNGRRKTGRL
jgi:hypothetical protein